MKIYCSRYRTIQEYLDALIGKDKWIRVNINKRQWSDFGPLYIRPVDKTMTDDGPLYSVNYLYVDFVTGMCLCNGTTAYDYVCNRTRDVLLSDINLSIPIDIRATPELLQIKPELGGAQ